MKNDNAIKTKSEDFAVRIVGLYKYLVDNKSEYVMSKHCGVGQVSAPISMRRCAEYPEGFSCSRCI